MSYLEKIELAWKQNQSLVCVGLDPALDKLPSHLSSDENGVLAFCREIIDATAPYVCAFKPQIAYFAAIGAESVLESLIRYIHTQYPLLPVILDAKRGDIGATAKMYAVEAFERYEADAVTVNPYMGSDTLQPFLEYDDRGVIVLCRTSNPGSGDFQTLSLDGKNLAHRVANRAANEWNGNNNVSLVVGATYPEELATIRRIVGSMPILVPGVGAQGGDLAAVLHHGLTSEQTGLMINVSRSVIYADDTVNFAQGAAQAARTLREEINSHRTHVNEIPVR